MKHRWRLIVLKIIMITALLLSLTGMITSHVAHASGCDTQGAFSICATSGGPVSVVQPTVSCSLGGSDAGYIDIMQGCNGSNWEKIGFSNFMGLQQWALRYGWTYSGTGDGYRYFTFINYSYFQPIDTSTWWITYSDGAEYNNNCYGGGHGCDYNAWNNYITAYTSPTAQLRDWVTTGRPGNQAFAPLEYPQPGLTNCQGSQTGVTSNVSFNLTDPINGGEMGVSASSTYQYHQDGQCNDGGADAYSTYMNLNWGGDSCDPDCDVYATQSPLSFLDVTSTNGPNGNNNRTFYQGWNLTVNWWDNPLSYITNVDLHEIQDQGPNGNFAQDAWHY
jgi:hypothetical protein